MAAPKNKTAKNFDNEKTETTTNKQKKLCMHFIAKTSNKTTTKPKHYIVIN